MVCINGAALAVSSRMPEVKSINLGVYGKDLRGTYHLPEIPILLLPIADLVTLS